MNDQRLSTFLDTRRSQFLKHYGASRDKYHRIWSLYEARMPRCIRSCDTERSRYSDDPGRDGPQGIYWIGENAKILFVGREHFGWYGPTEWEAEADIAKICYSPLEFVFYTVEAMGTYWAVVKDLVQDVLHIDLRNWEVVLRNVAFTNACKCVTDSNTLQWFFHQECFAQSYLEQEILTVAAPLNVLFTRSYGLSERLYSGQAVRVETSDEFSVQKIHDQVIIECAHPGRQSHEWRARLKGLMAQHLGNAEPAAAAGPR